MILLIFHVERSSSIIMASSIARDDLGVCVCVLAGDLVDGNVEGRDVISMSRINTSGQQRLHHVDVPSLYAPRQ